MIVSLTILFIISLLAFPCEPFRAPLLSEELGCSPTLSVWLGRPQYSATTKKRWNERTALIYFDPLNLATDINFPRLREAEYKHGRVAMLAMTEIILIPFVKRMDALTSWIGEQSLPPEKAIYNNLFHLKQEDIIKLLVTCAILEVFIFVQRNATDMPGDYGIGYFGVRDKAAHETQLINELEHGRLAMICFVVYLILDVVLYNEISWLDQWLGMFQGMSFKLFQ
jgi:Chlorophyll A-B binding protein